MEPIRWLAASIEDSIGISAWSDWLERNIKYFSDSERWLLWGEAALKIIGIIILTNLIVRITKRVMTHVMNRKRKSRFRVDVRRKATMGKLLENTITYTVNFVALMLILGYFGIDLRPFLAGAGVVGLAIGFGAQSLVKDVITGFFIIFEDQFAVGDMIQTGAYKGRVEEIGLRVTRIRSETGEMYIIPNGSILQVTNFSLNNAITVVDFKIPFDESIEKVTAYMERILLSQASEVKDLIGCPEVLGVQTMTNTEVTLRIQAECKANTEATVNRALNAIVKEAMERYYAQSTKGEA